MLEPILLVEDSPDDTFFMKRAFRSADIKRPLQVVEDGRQALAYLSGAEPYADRQQFPLPCLILLDLKLPHVRGLDVLKWIRQQPALATAIVIILTSSHLEIDIDRAYRMGANSFLVKPPNAEKLIEMVKRISEYWLDLNQPPPTNFAPTPGLPSAADLSETVAG